MRKIVVVALVLAVACLGWWIASPWMAMNGLAQAAKARDTAQLEERIDFPALRANTRQGLEGAVGSTGNDTLDSIGGAVLGNIADGALGMALTPQGVARMIEGGALVSGLLPERLRNQELSWSVEREGLNSFRGVSSFEDGTPGPVLLFERRGLGWQMSGIELAPSQP